MNAKQARELFADWLAAESAHIGETSTRIYADNERLLDVAERRARELGIKWTPMDAPEYVRRGTKYDDPDD